VLAALEEQRDFLLASLRDLDREHAAGDIDDADYESLKDDYTARAAAVIRSIQSRRAAFAGQRRRHGPGRTAATVAAVVLLAVAAGVLVARSAGERAPGQTASGNLGQTSRDLLLAAQDQMGRGDVLGAIQTYDQVLKVDPGNVEAMTYRGWLLRLSSFSATETADRELLQDQALQWLTKALEIDPDYADARVFRAIVHRDRDELEAARADLAALDLEAIPAFMRPLVENLRADLDGSPGTGSSGQTNGGR
jgi:tetratricopeptide (TPR) repeat protein